MFAFACMSFSSFAYFVWDPLTFGYENLFTSGSTRIGVSNDDATKLGALKPLLNFEETFKGQVHEFAFMPLIAGFGYLPGNAGFYFMCENLMGLGKGRVAMEKLDKTLKKTTDENGSISFIYTTSLIFGFAFSPAEDLHLSFGTGFSLGGALIRSSYDYNMLAMAEGNIIKNGGGFTFGLPIDITLRYYFGKHVGVLFGVQDIIGLALGPGGVYGKVSVAGNEVYANLAYGGGAFSNTFQVKLGLTTRW